MSVRAALRREMERGKKALATAGSDVPPALLRAAGRWLAETPGADQAVERMRADRSDEAAAELLALLAGPDDVTPPEPVIEIDPATAQAIADAIGRQTKALAPPVASTEEGDQLPAPGTRADRPAVDPSDALRAAADRALQRRRASPAPLPMEVLALYYGSLIDWIAAHCPGAAFADRSAADPDGWGPDHRAWREQYPAAAGKLDTLWQHDPHSAAFAAAIRAIVEGP